VLPTLPYQAVLLIAFGGPTAPDEVRPFLARVLRGVPVAPERIEEVAHHYQAVGGKSPFNEITFRQAASLQEFLEGKKLPIRVYGGMRNSRPFFSDTLKQMIDDGVSRTLGFILSSHRTEASWDRYQKNIADACAELGAKAPVIDYCRGWHDHPLFVQTWVELIQSEFAKIPAPKRVAAPLVFTAHSLPSTMAAKSPYVEQLQTSARLIADRLGHARWSIAYQSRSGKPGDPWLEPDIGRVIRDLAAQGSSAVVVAPVGFVCDHVEILYDLDIEAAKIAQDHGVRLLRVPCPNDHRTFIRMMADVIEERIKNIDNRE
jgi:ferrochelatase